MSFIQMDFQSQSLLRAVNIKVILPTDGFSGKPVQKPFKTLYFLPGYSANAFQLITYLSLRKQSELKELAIVLVDGENLFYQDLPTLNTNFSAFIKEVVEVTRETFPLSDKREETFIGGISMGGYGSLYNGIRHSDFFSKVVAFSPAIDPYSIMVEKQLPGFYKEQFSILFKDLETYQSSDTYLYKSWFAKSKQKPELWLCCGTEDILVFDQVDAFTTKLTEANISHTYEKSPGNHDIYYWEQMLDNAFSFLVGIEPGTRNELKV